MPDIAPSPGGVRVARIVTAGTLDRPDGPLTLENNTWVIGDDAECLVIDAGHDGRAIVKSIPREQRVQGVLITHGHLDHIDAVGEVCDGTRAPGIPAPRGPVPLGRALPRHPRPRARRRPGPDRRRRRAARDPHPGPHPGLVLLPRARHWASSSPATRCSPAARARPATTTATSTPSSSRCARGCSPCPRTPWCSPGTASRP